MKRNWKESAWQKVTSFPADENGQPESFYLPIVVMLLLLCLILAPLWLPTLSTLQAALLSWLGSMPNWFLLVLVAAGVILGVELILRLAIRRGERQ